MARRSVVDDYPPDDFTASHDEAPARSPAGFRRQPENVEAEQALLGAIMINNEAWHRVSGFLRPEHFYEPVHGRLYEAQSREISAGRLADHVTLKRAFEEDEALRELDGGKYLKRLTRAAETIINARDYGRLIHDLGVRRMLIHVAEAVVNRAYDPQEPHTAAEMVADLERDVSAVSAESALSSSKPFTSLGFDDIEMDLPQREFLVDQLIPKGCVTSLYGSGGTGKSFLAMMLGSCVAASKPWLGRFACEQGSVLAIMCEDDADELRRRRNQIARALHLGRADLEGRLHLVPRVGDENALMDFPGGIARRTALFEQIIADARRLRVKLIILDNAAQLFAGNENDRAQVTAFLNSVAGIARELGCAVLLLGHPPKVAGVEFSGSTAWDAVVRSRLWFRRAKDEDGNDDEHRYTLELVKSNYAKRFGVELEVNGSGVAEYVKDIEAGSQRAPRTHDRTMTALTELYVMHRRAIAVDELVDECIRRGIMRDAERNTAAWRDRRRTVKMHLDHHRRNVDDRGNDSYAVKNVGA